jgi:CRP-like cAMP-binding protein
MDAQELKAIPLFASLSDEDLPLVNTFVSEVSVSKGKHLVDEGDYAYEFFIIQEGTAEVIRGGEVVNQLGPGDFFGEVGLLEREKRNASVVAQTPMRLVVLSHWDLTRLQKRFPEAFARLREAAAARR